MASSLAFALALSVGVGLVVGLAPVFQVGAREALRDDCHRRPIDGDAASRGVA